jgi:hypothetical protein
MSHFACIGFDVADLGGLLDRNLHRAVQLPGARAEHLALDDRSGARLVVHLVKNELVCLTPSFVSPSPTVWSVKPTAHADPECPYCSGVDVDIHDADGNMITRATIQLERGEEEPLSETIAVVCFAHELRAFPSEEAFHAAPRELRIASQAFMPTGMFAPPEATMVNAASAWFAGRVSNARTLTTALTRGRFVHVVVETLPGPIDVVADVAAAPNVGDVVEVHGWLVGRA